MSVWRTDARPALAGVLALQLVMAAATVVRAERTGSDANLVSHLAWTVLVAALLWLIWAHCSAAARGVLLVAIGFPLVLLIAFSAPGWLVLLLILLSGTQLLLLWSPAVRQRVRPRRDDIPHY